MSASQVTSFRGEAGPTSAPADSWSRTPPVRGTPSRRGLDRTKAAGPQIHDGPHIRGATRNQAHHPTGETHIPSSPQQHSITTLTSINTNIGMEQQTQHTPPPPGTRQTRVSRSTAPKPWSTGSRATTDTDDRNEHTGSSSHLGPPSHSHNTRIPPQQQGRSTSVGTAANRGKASYAERSMSGRLC
jgi:hypothetical protein